VVLLLLLLFYHYFIALASIAAGISVTLSHYECFKGTLHLNDRQSAGKDMPNSVVFSFRRNACSDWISLTKVSR